LLDGPSVGAFVSRRDTQPWIVDRGVARVAGGPALIDLQTPPEPTFRGPVAVLIGAHTRNAGEDVTVAFEGRARTRFFGTRTAGFPILGVRVHRLSDGTMLGVLETRDVDRTGRIHRLPVEPDTELPPDAALATWPRDVIDWVLDERVKASSTQ
jgi:C-terminal processing protease CtpA/Prc